MSDEPEIPAHLIELQRGFDAAHAAVVAASRRPGRMDTWPPEVVEELERLRAREREAAVELHRARAGTPFKAYEQQRRLLLVARSQG